MFQEYLAIDLVLTIGMCFFLAMGAWFDAHGNEVPDALTVPYAILGIAASLLHGRPGTALIAGLLLVFILQPYRPKFLRKLNDWFLRRTYRDDEEMQAEVDTEAAEAEAFMQKNESRASKATQAAYITVSAALVLAAFYCGWTENVFIAVLVAVCGLLIYLRFLLAHANNDMPEQEEDEPLEMTAFGGADALIFIGMLAFYGAFTWLICLIATMIGCLIWVLAQFVMTKKKTKGIALLPAILVTAPVRMVLALTLCVELASVFYLP